MLSDVHVIFLLHRVFASRPKQVLFLLFFYFDRPFPLLTPCLTILRASLSLTLQVNGARLGCTKPGTSRVALIAGTAQTLFFRSQRDKKVRLSFFSSRHLPLPLSVLLYSPPASSSIMFALALLTSIMLASSALAVHLAPFLISFFLPSS